MKGGYVTAVAFAAVVVVAFAEDHPIRPIPDKCPEEDSKDFTVHLKHENDCTKFYQCFRGQPIEMSCPYMNKKKDRLHFNALLQVCDWPNRAGCQSHTTNTVDREPTTSPTPVWNSTWDCSFASDGTKIPHKTRCHLFYECEDHVAVLKTCASGLFFDPYDQQCNLPSGNRCPIKNPCRDYKSKEGKYFPDYESCKHLYFCKDTETRRYECPVNAEWSYDVEKCLLKGEAVCAH